MRYANITDIKEVKDVKRIFDTLDTRNDYDMYVGFCDSLYAISDIENDDESVYLVSQDDRGTIKSCICAEEFKKLLKGLPNTNKVFSNAAGNLDPDLDMQMEDEAEIVSISIDDISKMIILIAG